MDVATDPSNIKDCQWLKSDGPKNLIPNNKNKLKGMKLCSIGISFYKRQFLFTLQDVMAKIQKLWSNKYIHAFWGFNGILRLKLTVSGRVHVITHCHDLDELFPVPTVWAFTEKFRRLTNSFLQVDLYFSLLVLIVDSYFALFIRLCFSAKKCAHLMGKILLGVCRSEIRMSTNIVPVTLQLALINFSPLGIFSFLKMHVNLNQYRGRVGTFNNRNYCHKLTLSLG